MYTTAQFNNKLILHQTEYWRKEEIAAKVAKKELLSKKEVKPNGSGLNKIKTSLVFDKLFQNALKPSKVEPYYFEGQGTPGEFEVTLTSLITVDRFPKLLNCMKTFDGPVSVALHINDDEMLNLNLYKLNNFISSNLEFIRNRLDIHVVIDKFPRQLNYLRNIARFFSKTDLLLPLDVDFIVNKNLIKNLIRNQFALKKLYSGEAVFIIPAFEFMGELKSITTFENFPQKKEQVVNLFDDKKLMIFHGPENKGHLSTNYTIWLNATESYQIESNSFSYEPYAIVNKNTVPWSDERFVGYGGNKAAWWYEIYLSGLEFWVLPNDFLIHQYHEYDDSIRVAERQRNVKLFWNFLPEICGRYRVRLQEYSNKKLDMMGCREGAKSRF